MIIPFDERPTSYVNFLFEGSVQVPQVLAKTLQTINVISSSSDQGPVASRTRSSNRRQTRQSTERTQGQRVGEQTQENPANLEAVQAEQEPRDDFTQPAPQIEESQDFSLVLPQEGIETGEAMLIVPSTQETTQNPQELISNPIGEGNEYLAQEYLAQQAQFQNVQTNIAQTVIINQQQYWYNHTVPQGQDFMARVEQTLIYLKERVEYSVQLSDDLRVRSHEALTRLRGLCDQGNRTSQESYANVNALREQTKTLAQETQNHLQDLMNKDQHVRQQVNNFVTAQRQLNFKFEQSRTQTSQLQNQMLVINDRLESVMELQRTMTDTIDQQYRRNQDLQGRVSDLQLSQERINQTLEQRLQQIRDSIGNIRHDFGNHQYEIEELQHQIDNLEADQAYPPETGRVVLSQEDWDRLRVEIPQTQTRLQTELEDIRLRVLRQNLGGRQGDIQQIEGDVIDLRHSIGRNYERANDRFVEIESLFQNYQDASNSLRSEVDELFAEREQQRQRSRQVDEQLAQYPPLSREFREWLGTFVESKIAEAETRLRRSAITVQEAPRSQQQPPSGTSNHQAFSINTGQVSQGPRRTFTPYRMPSTGTRRIEDTLFQNRPIRTQMQHSLWFDGPSSQTQQPQNTPNSSRMTEQEPYYQRMNMFFGGTQTDPPPATAPPPGPAPAPAPAAVAPPDDSSYSYFKFDEQFDGEQRKAFIWLDRFLTQVNKHRLNEDQIFSQIRYLFTQAAASWYHEYDNTHGFHNVQDFLQQFVKQYEVDQLKLHNKFHQTNKRPNETAQQYLNRLRDLAIPARISTTMVKEKFLLAIQPEYSGLDPFTILKIQNDPDISTQNIIEILEDFKDKQEYQRLVSHNQQKTTGWTSKKSRGGKGNKPDSNQKSAPQPKPENSFDLQEPKPQTKYKGSWDPKKNRNWNRNKPDRNRRGKTRANYTKGLHEMLLHASMQSDNEQSEDEQSQPSTKPDLQDSPDEDEVEEEVDQELQEDPSSSTQPLQQPLTIGTIQEEHEGDEVAEYVIMENSDENHVNMIKEFEQHFIQEDDFRQRQQIPADQAQNKMQEELISLNYKAEKACHLRDRKQEQYGRKYQDTKQNRSQYQQPSYDRNPQVPQQPAWRINNWIVVNSAKIYIQLVKEVVHLLDRPGNLLSSDQSLAQANRLVDTLQRRYDALQEDVARHRSNKEVTMIRQTVGAITKSNTKNLTCMPYQKRYKQGDKSSSINRDLEPKVTLVSDGSTQTYVVVKSGDFAPLLFAKLEVKKNPVFAMIDTGATLSAISLSVAQKLELKLTDTNQKIIVMDEREIPITKQVQDCVIQFDESFAVRTNLIVCEQASFPLLLGRNVQQAADACIIGQRLYYSPPDQRHHRRIPLYEQKWRSRKSTDHDSSKK